MGYRVLIVQHDCEKPVSFALYHTLEHTVLVVEVDGSDKIYWTWQDATWRFDYCPRCGVELPLSVKFQEA